jgi:hypothetical protein
MWSSMRSVLKFPDHLAKLLRLPPLAKEDGRSSRKGESPTAGERLKPEAVFDAVWTPPPKPATLRSAPAYHGAWSRNHLCPASREAFSLQPARTLER